MVSWHISSKLCAGHGHKAPIALVEWMQPTAIYSSVASQYWHAVAKVLDFVGNLGVNLKVKKTRLSGTKTAQNSPTNDIPWDTDRFMTW